MKEKTFVPKLFTTLRYGYDRKKFTADLVSGITVGIVALPLAIAFAIASGVSPEKGLYTAIVAGFIISFLGGSRVQIGGPTGAFIVIVAGIVTSYGISGLTVATFMAGVMIILMGFTRLGSVIKFIPYSLIVGFTSGIALIIFSSQVKDFLGLSMDAVPGDFISKWQEYVHYFGTVNVYAVIIAVSTVMISLISVRLHAKIPGSLIAILLSTLAVQFFNLPVETIESRFGVITAALPVPAMPDITYDTFLRLIEPAFAIALLGAIESLLSAVVADGMVGGNHRSNMELVAQGTANVFSSVFGGIPATGALARTVTNIKNGGRTPVAGMIHAVTLLIILLFFGKWARLIPLSCLAGILVVVAYNMSEWKSFLNVNKGPRGDIIILWVSFLLTVFVDLIVAIQIGLILAAFLFIRKMTQYTRAEMVIDEVVEEEDDPLATSRFIIPKGVLVYEVNGPLFFGAARQFRETMKVLEQHPKILILRMRHVPFIDATGILNLKDVIKEFESIKTRVILSGVQPRVYEELNKARIIFRVGKKNVCPDIKCALTRAGDILDQLAARKNN